MASHTKNYARLSKPDNAKHLFDLLTQVTDILRHAEYSHSVWESEIKVSTARIETGCWPYYEYVPGSPKITIHIEVG